MFKLSEKNNCPLDGNRWFSYCVDCPYQSGGICYYTTCEICGSSINENDGKICLVCQADLARLKNSKNNE